jgi:hypothetical protein
LRELIDVSEGLVDRDLGARSGNAVRRRPSPPSSPHQEAGEAGAVAPSHDFIDRRALAALQFVDVTGAPVSCPLAVEAEETTFIRKGGGRVAVMTAPGLDAHAAEFDIPPRPTPAPQSVTVKVDVWPADRGLAPRRFSLTVPRAHGLQTGASQPVQVELLPTPAATPGALVAALAVTVRRASDQHRIEGAVVRFRPEGGRAPSRAVTNAAGEALLLVPCAPSSMVVEIAGKLDAFVDPSLVRLAAAVEPDDGLPVSQLDHPIDPDEIQARIAPSPAATARVASGELRTAAIIWSP